MIVTDAPRRRSAPHADPDPRCVVPLAYTRAAIRRIPSGPVRRGAGEPQGLLQVPGANRTKPSVAHSFSASPTANSAGVEREGTWFGVRREPGPVWREWRFTVAVAAMLALAPGSAAAAIDHGRRPDPGRRSAGPAERHRHPVAERPERRHSEPRLRQGQPAQVSFYYGVHNPSLRFEIESTQPQNDLRIDVIERSRRSRAQLLPQRRRTPLPGQHPLGRRRPRPSGRPPKATTASGSARRRPRGSPCAPRPPANR